MLDGDCSAENQQEVADHFQVSDRTILTLLVNQRRLETPSGAPPLSRSVRLTTWRWCLAQCRLPSICRLIQAFKMCFGVSPTTRREPRPLPPKSARPSNAAARMIFYCECAAGFSDDVGMQDEGYFDALVRMFDQALKAVSALPDGRRPALLDRLDVVRRISHNFGYGVGDDMDELLAQYGADD